MGQDKLNSYACHKILEAVLSRRVEAAGSVQYDAKERYDSVLGFGRPDPDHPLQGPIHKESHLHQNVYSFP